MKVLVNSTPIGLWREVVHEAQVTCETALEAELEAYLVFLLARYMNKPEITRQIMATQLLDGLALSLKKRETALQEVGDTCLLFSGLFPGIAEKRLVKISYFVNLGKGAYVAISKTNNDLYGLLAQHFVSIMDVLQSIRQYSRDLPDLLPFQAYDLWNESGSQRALKVLKHYTNATPLSVTLTDKEISLIKIK